MSLQSWLTDMATSSSPVWPGSSLQRGIRSSSHRSRVPPYAGMSDSSWTNLWDIRSANGPDAVTRDFSHWTSPVGLSGGSSVRFGEAMNLAGLLESLRRSEVAEGAE